VENTTGPPSEVEPNRTRLDSSAPLPTANVCYTSSLACSRQSATGPFADSWLSCHSARMTTRGLFLVSALAALVVLASWWSQNRSRTENEQLLFSMLDASIAKTPPDAADIIAAFDLPEACQEKTCFLEPGMIGGFSFNGGNLRPPKEGLIFVLEDFKGSCIRTKRAQTYYDTEEPRQNCSHGGCWGTHAQYSWGILSFGLDKRNSTCVSSVVINSMPYQRPRN